MKIDVLSSDGTPVSTRLTTASAWTANIKPRARAAKKPQRCSLSSVSLSSTTTSTSMSSDASSSRPPNTVLPRGASCLVCRKRKIKCDGKKPCGPCTRSIKFHECVYDQSAAKKTRVEVLQDRVKELEDRLEEAESCRNSSLLPAGQPRHHPYRGRRAHSDSSSPDSNSYELYHEHSLPLSASPIPFSTEISLYPPSSPHAYDHHAFMTSPPSWTTSLPRHRSSSFLDEDIDPNLKQYLITTFLLHHQQCFLELPISSFLDSINLPSDSGGRHPALLNAIYLIACHFSPDRSFVTQEALFLERARQGLLDSLEMAERLDDYQVASSLIACYLLFKGRLLEAHQAASTSARFAVSCGLHQILSSSTAGNAWNQMRGRPLLAPPGDALELAGRVNAFWQAFSVDRSVSAWGDLPFAFLDEEISTYWPVPCDAATDCKDAKGLFSSESEAHSQEDPGTLCVKSMALLSRTLQFARKLSSTQIPDEWTWSVYKTVDTSITQFLDTLAPITKTINLDGTAPSVAANLVFAHVLTCQAGIELHGMFANDDPNEYQKCLYYANRIMKVVYDIQDTNSSLWHLMVGLGWMAALRVLKQELIRTQAVSDVQGANNLQADITTLTAVIHRLGDVFPIIAIEFGRVEQSA